MNISYSAQKQQHPFEYCNFYILVISLSLSIYIYIYIYIYLHTQLSLYIYTLPTKSWVPHSFFYQKRINFHVFKEIHFFFYVWMQLCNDLNQNQHEIMIILIKAIFFFRQRIHPKHLLLQSKFSASLQVTYKSMFMLVIPTFA